MLVAGGARAEARALLEAHVDDDSRVALELAGMLLQGGDLAGAGQIASTRIT
jgi:hypothetical protein